MHKKSCYAFGAQFIRTAFHMDSNVVKQRGRHYARSEGTLTLKIRNQFPRAESGRKPVEGNMYKPAPRYTVAMPEENQH